MILEEEVDVGNWDFGILGWESAFEWVELGWESLLGGLRVIWVVLGYDGEVVVREVVHGGVEGGCVSDILRVLGCELGFNDGWQWIWWYFNVGVIKGAFC